MGHGDSKTKIIATLGPASSSREVLREMFEFGVDVCRLNFSHGKHEDHLASINTIRELNKELDMNVAILADLQGPKLRVGEIENNGVELIDGQEIVFTNIPCAGTAKKVYLSYPKFPVDVKKGGIVLVDDGKIKLEVLETDTEESLSARILEQEHQLYWRAIALVLERQGRMEDGQH